MTELEIMYRSIDDLIPYSNNARTHNEAQVAQIAASITEFGWTNPIIVDHENVILAGHGRILAARKLNLDKVPTLIVTDMTDAQKRAYILADNKLALNAGWDLELLSVEIERLSIDDEFDLSLTGFNPEDLQALNMEPDEIEEIEDVNESCNFIVKCDDIAQREILKTELGTKSDKLDFEKFMECLRS